MTIIYLFRCVHFVLGVSSTEKERHREAVDGMNEGQLNPAECQIDRGLSLLVCVLHRQPQTAAAENCSRFQKKNYLGTKGIEDIDCTNEWAEESGCKVEAGDGTFNKREFRRQLHEMG